MVYNFGAIFTKKVKKQAAHLSSSCLSKETNINIS